MTKDDGGPFHPTTFGLDGSIGSGASFRAVAAMHAMAGLLADPQRDGPIELFAELAVEAADALIAELKK